MSGGRAAAEGSIESESSPRRLHRIWASATLPVPGPPKREFWFTREACERGWKYFLNERLKAFWNSEALARDDEQIRRLLGGQIL